MRTLGGLIVVVAVLSSWMGIAQAQDQPAAEAANLGQETAVQESAIETQPEAAEGQEASQIPKPADESAAAETKASSTAPFIGNSGSKKVHRADCRWGAKTSPRKRVYFNTYEEAVKAGYIPCKACKPDLAAKGVGSAKSVAPGAAEEGYCASVKGKAFHRPSCRWAQKISPANLVKYKTREEAIAAGKKPCSSCMP